MNRLRLGLLVSMVALEGLVLGRGALPDGAILPAGQGVLVDIPVDADLLPLIGVLAKVTHDHGIHDVIKGSIMVHGTDYPFAYDGLLTSAQLQAMPGLGEGASVAI